MLNINATVIVQIINFLIMVVILAIVAYKPLLKIMHERESKIANDIANAEAERLQAVALRGEYQKQLNQAKLQAQHILERAIHQAEEAKEQILADTKAENAKVLSNLQDEIARESAKALVAVRTEVISIALQCAEKVVGREVQSADNERLITDYLKQLATIDNGDRHVN